MNITFELPVFIFGIVQVVKQLGLPYISSSKVLPLWAVVLGGVLNPVYMTAWTPETILTGAFIGLVTTGIVAGADKYVGV